MGLGLAVVVMEGSMSGYTSCNELTARVVNKFEKRRGIVLTEDQRERLSEAVLNVIEKNVKERDNERHAETVRSNGATDRRRREGGRPSPAGA